MQITQNKLSPDQIRERILALTNQMNKPNISNDQHKLLSAEIEQLRAELQENL
jgi:hypothetical protein